MNVEKIANKSNVKLTTARRAILEILIKNSHPLSYEDIKDELSMDKATFYRNISIFEDENIITSFESNDRKRYFEIQKNVHSHFICTNCSKIECIHEKPTFNLVGYKIDNIVIKGICPNCLHKGN
ncbi:Fur family transcriptional regulator [Halarcobacter bivalviorum]|uniref:Fur family transcriptional regulator n=1 Tax=Halarcobacter bivalviorum TaxID=663364 RepID=A0AAX2A599_9BACT|nr:Fur family transcriptional regulator [Halarcobacter bivalviorum]AXH12851.1 transcriptional regulator, Fur family [Halarcobacter bivalviorum]RXK04463.1 Fur family transcriptional regulator [Halarcobacter bivalviorum]RXK09024.1 Fur family transcriptional regulator [Halarcobacter bivalviorum]